MTSHGLLLRRICGWFGGFQSNIYPYPSCHNFETEKFLCGPLTALVNTTRGSRVGPAQSARENHPTRGKAPFLAWGDFHARTLFAPSTIPEEKW